jgi:hypothetical protein
MKVESGSPPNFTVIHCVREQPAVVQRIIREMLHPKFLEIIRNRRIIVSLREFHVNIANSTEERKYAVETMLRSLDSLIIGRMKFNGQWQETMTLQQFLHFHAREDHAITIVLASKDAVSPPGIVKGKVTQKVEVSVMLIPENANFADTPSFKSFETYAILVDPSAGCPFYDVNNLDLARLYLGRMVPLYLDASGWPQKTGEAVLVETDLWNRIIQRLRV